MRVIFRDTSLLAPPKTSLATIGKQHGEQFEKIEISKDDIENMDKMLSEKPEEFTAYALQDALIALIHGLKLELFVNTMGITGIPVTISSISNSYTLHQ